MEQIKNLYENLMKLTEHESEAFYYKDYPINDNECYRLFDYHLATYALFCLPDACAARGIMFHLKDGELVNISSRPMDKFFNFKENPFTMDIDINEDPITSVMIKMDGSLISSYMDIGTYTVKLKSKGSISSEHAIASMEMMKADKEFENDVATLTAMHYTVNMEYTSPRHRIVVPYSDNLTVLNVRNNITGDYLSIDEMKKYPSLYNKSVHNGEYIIPEFITSTGDIDDICSKIRKLDTGIEGYIIVLKSGLTFKVKTQWYCDLHALKDNINIPSRLFEAVLNDNIDDISIEYMDDPYALERIELMTELVHSKYNHYKKVVSDYIEKFGHLDRKSIALILDLVYEAKVINLGVKGLILSEYNKKPDIKYKKVFINHEKKKIINEFVDRFG